MFHNLFEEQDEFSTVTQEPSHDMEDVEDAHSNEMTPLKHLEIVRGACKEFSKNLKEMEVWVARETQWGYWNSQNLNVILENSQNILIASLQNNISQFEEERTRF